MSIEAMSKAYEALNKSRPFDADNARMQRDAMDALRTAIQQAEAKTDEPDDVVKDAERYRWLRSRMCGADFDWNESGIYGLVFELPDDAKVSANCDKTIDAAMTAAAQAQKGQP